MAFLSDPRPVEEIARELIAANDWYNRGEDTLAYLLDGIAAALRIEREAREKAEAALREVIDAQRGDWCDCHAIARAYFLPLGGLNTWA